MNHSRNRRKLLLAAVSVPLACSLSEIIATIGTSWAAQGNTTVSAQARLAKLERTLAGRLGVFALNTANGTQLSYHADEYFPMCSTFKVLLASAILKRSTQIDGLMQQRIKYQQSDLVTYSPITKQHIEDGMTVDALCAAAIQYSDNTASNLLMTILGGPGAVTTFARSIVDVVKEIAKEVDRSPSQVSLNWLVQQPGKPIPIIGARKVAHVEYNIGALDFTLSVEQIDRLNQASSFAMPFPYSFINGDSPMAVNVLDGKTSIESGFSVYK